MAMFVHNALSPWLGVVDADRYGALCDRVESLGIRAIATAHAPLITEEIDGEGVRDPAGAALGAGAAGAGPGRARSDPRGAAG